VGGGDCDRRYVSLANDGSAIVALSLDGFSNGEDGGLRIPVVIIIVDSISRCRRFMYLRVGFFGIEREALSKGVP
jgi:hypothetical protein